MKTWLRVGRLRQFVFGNWWLLTRSVAAAVLAAAYRIPGQEFSWFGRKAGIRAVIAGEAFGPELVLTPVSITRYWEFPFVWRHLPPAVDTCLDVASPRLFALYVARRLRPTSVRVINPDERDAEVTARAARLLGARAIKVDPLFVSALADDRARYDAIWSISVLEHIPGEGDVEAMTILYRALAPGGRLLITVPADRHAWTEYRATDTYGLGLKPGPDGYFFQRWYDEAALRSRLIDPISPDSVAFEWFGERRTGRFAKYIQEWMDLGPSRTMVDPLEIARHYRTFGSWVQMPGQGVCGLVISKRA